MLAPTSKRRKISEAASLPPRSPANHSVRRMPSSLRKTDIRGTPTRASFLSPTKASLARHNPDLLTRLNAAKAPGKSPLRPVPVNATVHAQEGKSSFAENFIRRGRKSLGQIGENEGSPRDDEEKAIALAQDAEKEDDDDDEALADEELTREIASTIDFLNSAEVEEENQQALAPVLEKELFGEAEEDNDALPRGMLFATPRTRKSKALGELLRDVPSMSKPVQSTKTRGREQSAARGPELQPHSSLPTAADQVNAVPATAPDSDRLTISKQKERLHLQRELKKLEDEVKRYERELQGSQDHLANDLPVDDLVKLINSTDSSLPAALSHKQLPLSHRLSAFLPFAKPATLPTPPPSPPSKAIPSHRPLDLDDPLPYLRLFTPFECSSVITLPDQGGDPEMQAQRHELTMRSPQNALVLKAAMTVDRFAQRVIDLGVLHLSTWAEAELGSFIRTEAKTLNIGNVCWAMQSYWHLATKRAECWKLCAQRFGSPVREGNPEETTSLDPISQTVPSNPQGKQTFKLKHLRNHLGQPSFVLDHDHAIFTIRWKIDFDWTGEAQSSVDIDVAVPASWKQIDERRSLTKMRSAFKALLKRRGVFKAIEGVAGLLFS